MAMPEHPSADLPDIDPALAELSRRTGRAFASLLVRVVAIGVLNVLLVRAVPGLRSARLIMDLVGVALAVWPFFTALGRTYAWRIALGRSYVRAERWLEAQRTLAPLRYPRVRLLFDAAGEGIYLLARTELALGAAEEARRLFAVLAGEGRGKWSAEAQQALMVESDAATRYAESGRSAVGRKGPK